MKQQVYLSLIFHNHQPVGNFDFVFREAFEKSYLPLIQALERHPAVSAAMHFSGPLRDWLLVNEPAYYLEAVGALVSRSQLELLGGAYYEPILVMLDDADKIGQLHKLSDAVEADFGVRPRGMWLAERVWEPYLAKPIAQAGLAYTVVDDTHFHFAGFRDEDLYGYYVTEEQGWPLRIIPAPKFMRNSLPWGPVEDFLSDLRRLGLDESTSANRLFTMADDGEKFGLWPGTYRRCWQDGYIDELFTALADASDWLRTVTPSEYLDQFPALGRAYMPAASYLEMTEWALPAAGAAALPAVRKRLAQEATRSTLDPELAADLVEVQHYLRGGLWRNFLVKYPEANHMQKRCNYISHRLRQMPEGEAKDEALAHLWAAQCNCGYWHGVFGGIYLFHIRVANYQNLLQALKILLDETVQVEQLDFDLDGANEIVINSDLFSLVIDPAYGGAIFEWDDVPSRYNVLNVIARRREGYHIRLEETAANDAVITPEHPDWDRPQGHQARAKALGLERELVVDWHRRGMLIDHFLDSETTLESFSHVAYEEQADFVAQPYAVDVEETDPWQAVITLTRNGTVRQSDGQHPLCVEKTLTVRTNERSLPVRYTLTNTGDQTLDLRFGIEMCYGFDGGDSDQCGLRLYRDQNGQDAGHLGLQGGYQDVRAYEVYTRIRGFRVNVTLDGPAELWRFPLAPVTISEAGFERIHQGAVFLHRYHITLAPGEAWHTGLRFAIESL